MATPVFLGFPGGSDSKASACSVGDLGSGLVALSMQGVPVQSQVRDLRSHMPCSAAKKKKTGEDDEQCGCSVAPVVSNSAPTLCDPMD